MVGQQSDHTESCGMSNSNAAVVLAWLDSTIAETGDPAERAVIMQLAEGAARLEIAASRRVNIVPPTGISWDEIGHAIGRLRDRGWLERGWLLTFPEEAA